MYYAAIKGTSPFGPSSRKFDTFNAAMNHAVSGYERNGVPYQVYKIKLLGTVGEDEGVKDDEKGRDFDDSFSAENLKAASEWSKRLNER